MTNISQGERTCFVCGEQSRQKIVASTNAFGPCDLDLRPAQQMRSTIHCWMHRCPHCGYCAPDLSLGPAEEATSIGASWTDPQPRHYAGSGAPDWREVAAQIVQSDAYAQQRDDASYPGLANWFLRWAIVQETVGDLSNAGWAATCAAWVCDDAVRLWQELADAPPSDLMALWTPASIAANLADLYGLDGNEVWHEFEQQGGFGNKDQEMWQPDSVMRLFERWSGVTLHPEQAGQAAERCRLKAVGLFTKTRDGGLSFTDGPGAEEAMLADLLRRSGAFDRVDDICREGLAVAQEDVVRQILEFQRVLASREDRECYTVADAAEFAER